MNINGKTILLTGASTGIGKALAYQFAKERVNLALAARRIELLEDLKNELIQLNSNILIQKCDVGKKSDVINAYNIIKEKFAGVDIAILNAGVGHYMNVEKYDSGFAEDIYGANLFGIFYWLEQLLPDFLKRKEGIIAGVSSLADNRGYSGSSFYSSSKAALTNYLEGLRVELYPYGVKVITVRPGFVKTPMTSTNKFCMPYLMSPDKAASIIIDGIKKQKRVIQFPWQMVLLTNIVGLLPGGFYEALAKRQFKKLKKEK
ncbi:MAG: SDR family NAD(P)-dependent oxidoreductase [Melioribacteraceae bacterium]|nr:SDR family NAD(P)-dependent oxidoreductase [Melioribacteraceae bacterium]